jgi:hypothetical protein
MPDLIVLGATHRSAFENLTRDRTVYQVLAHARCPVLTIREPQQWRLTTRFPRAAVPRLITRFFCTPLHQALVVEAFLARLREVFKLVDLNFALREDGLHLEPAAHGLNEVAQGRNVHVRSLLHPGDRSLIDFEHLCQADLGQTPRFAELIESHHRSGVLYLARISASSSGEKDPRISLHFLAIVFTLQSL